MVGPARPAQLDVEPTLRGDRIGAVTPDAGASKLIETTQPMSAFEGAPPEPKIVVSERPQRPSRSRGGPTWNLLVSVESRRQHFDDEANVRVDLVERNDP